MHIALIATVKNESRHLQEFLDSIEQQTRRPDTIIIIDDDSMDNTLQILKEYQKTSSVPSVHIDKIPSNRSRARNIATMMAFVRRAEIIVSVDISQLDKRLIEAIILPIEHGHVEVVGGWTEPILHNEKEQIIGRMTLFSQGQIRPETFVPSGPWAYTIKAWLLAGGWPEHLNTSEDLYFAKKLREKGFKLSYAPEARVYWRPSALSLKAIFKRFYQFAITDSIANLKTVKEYLPLYSIYGLLVLVAVFPIIFLGWIPMFAVYIAYRLRKIEEVEHIPYALAIMFAMDFARLIGFLRGKVKR